MNYLENYHYAAYLFSIALLSEKVELSRKIVGSGMQREVYYQISSPDKKYNETFSFFHIPRTKNPYKRELYNLLSYIYSVKGFKVPKEVKNDEEMLARYLYLVNETLHMNDVKISFCSSREDFEKRIAEISKPLKTANDWRMETETNFIPMCREHIILVSTEHLLAEILQTQNKVKPEQVEDAMDISLSLFGFKPEQTKQMRKISAAIPPDALPQPQ